MKDRKKELKDRFSNLSDSDKLAWIIGYLEKHKVVDVLNRDFVDAYIDQFKPKHYIMMVGANKVPELGRILASGYKQGLLTRSLISLSGGAWMPGFPKWIYCYQLSKDEL